MKEILNGELAVIGMRGCEDFVRQVDSYLCEWRRHDGMTTFIAQADCGADEPGRPFPGPQESYCSRRRKGSPYFSYNAHAL